MAREMVGRHIVNGEYNRRSLILMNMIANNPTIVGEGEDESESDDDDDSFYPDYQDSDDDTDTLHLS